jgi:anti-sigma B factor antagonist
MENTKNIEKFSLTIEHFQGWVVIKIQGYLDAHTSPILESTISDTIKNGENKIVIDFEHLDYISSAGFGVFMEFIEEIRENEGDIVLVNLNEKIHKLFELLGFTYLFKIYPTINELI